MTSGPQGEHLKIGRRRVVRAVSGLTTLGIIGTGCATPVAADPGEQQWVYETGDSVQSSPTVINSTVFVGSNDGYLYALDANTGDQRWAFETGGSVESSPTAVDDTVFIGSFDTNLYAVDIETGDQQWVFETGDPVRSSPTVVDGTVFVGSGDGNLYAVDADTGNQQWAFDTEGFGDFSPIVMDDTVFIGSFVNLYALDANTGDLQWIFETEDSISSEPTVADGTVFVGNLYAVDAETGTEKWKFEAQESGFSSPTVISDTVFVGSDDSYLYAVDAETGTEKWKFEAQGSGFSSPTVVNNTVFVGGPDRNLYAVDAESGEKEWTFETNHRIFSSPTVIDGTVLFGSSDNNIYAVDAGVDGSSEGSRVMLGTLGHHDNWWYAGQSIDISVRETHLSTIQNNREWLAIGGIGTIVAGGYLIRQRRANQKSVEKSPKISNDESSSAPSAENENQIYSTEKRKIEGSLSVEECRTEAETAIKRADTAKSNNNLNAAVDAYNEALRHCQIALGKINTENKEKRAKIETSIDTIREDLELVKTDYQQRKKVTETLQSAERSLQEAIVAFVEKDQTLARIRFRQARNTFKNARKAIDDCDKDVLASPIEISSEKVTPLPSTVLDDITLLEDTTLEALSEADIETVTELEADTGTVIPTVVTKLEENNEISEEESTLLTLLSWWYEGDGREIINEAMISSRYERADFGFEKSG